MADVLAPFGALWKRLRDMGDGTHAEVVYAAGSGGGGGGSGTSDTTEATQLLVKAAVQNLDADIGAPADAAATSDSGTFSLFALCKRGLQSLTTLLGRLPTAIGPQNAAGSLSVTLASDGALVTAVGTTTASAPVAGATSGTLIGWVRALVEEIRARLPDLSSGRIPVESKSQSVVTYEISIAGLAAGATALSPVINLGNPRASLLVIAEKFGGANQGDTLQFIQSGDAGMGSPRPIMRGDTIGNSAGFTQAAGQQALVYGRPTSQYMQAQFTCLSGGSAQPAGAVLVVSLHWGR